MSGLRLPDPLRLALGTLTVVRVPPPTRLDRETAGRAMLLAPLAALPLALLVLVVCLAGRLLGAPLLVTAGVALGLLALGSRGMHLDGLADTADGLASAYDRDRALEVMRRGDVGPAGAVTLVLVLLVQAAALADVLRADRWTAAAAPAVAVLVSRAVLPLACRRGLPAARPEGLGSTVAGSIAPFAAVLVLALTAGVGALALGWQAAEDVPRWLAGPLATATAAVAALGLLARCRARLGGVTGDVLGAAVEVALTAALVVLSLLV
ncbi:adenosylcobinamide-GDP ribazoletransferase [Angustibacter aerolatus]|uniref:Adenosylcobinamide-GDP ribazoletransferase n=1 Tax=Angustibacter aerolatus TaxID=1162965 RepID=A0ABQ6JQM8_9ACTN|nr:adenosylcobinamide-GDP ribazoletransferase [Angustibacter aerolatus]GMA89020.1 adenosylcobinamide-GDP ribazoletransferase [Angustibacter aerolatus]